MNRRVGTAIAALVLVAGLPACRRGGTKPSAAGPEANVLKASTMTPTMPGKRLVYPWSVVAGGVDSPLAMQEAMEKDPVVETHYAGLQPGNFQPQRLSGKKQGYVSYRIRDKIYWTRRMVTLAAGENVLTDGKTLVRGRCGNLYSETPRLPLAPVELEPTEAVMDQPVRAVQLMTVPDIPVEKPVETEKFENPKQLASNANSLLPPPQAEDSLPPSWVTGGIPGPGGGVMGIGGFGGGGSTPNAAPTTPENPTPVAPDVPLTPVTPETAPPLVYVALTVPPSLTYFPPVVITTPLGPEYPVYVPPLYPPVPSPQPPSTWNPPTTNPPTTNPPTTNPPENPPPPVIPPPTNPPVNPPPSDPPIFPPGEPPAEPPPDVSVPEPGAWVLAILGIAAIAFGSIRRKT